MYHAALRVKQNVAIVPVFNLQDVAQQRVASHRLKESVAGLCISLASPARIQLLLRGQLRDSLFHLRAYFSLTSTLSCLNLALGLRGCGR